MIDQDTNFAPKGLETFRPLAITMIVLALTAFGIYAAFRLGVL